MKRAGSGPNTRCFFFSRFSEEIISLFEREKERIKKKEKMKN